MSVKIRLARIGKKKVPFFRLVAVDSRVKRDGAYLTYIGTYDALKGTVVTFHEDRYTDWISKGAVASDTAKKVYKIYKRGKNVPATPAETPVKKSVKKAAPKVEKVAEQATTEVAAKS